MRDRRNDDWKMCERRAIRFTDERCFGGTVERHVAAALRSDARSIVHGLLAFLLVVLAAALVSHIAVEPARVRSPRGLKPDDHHQRQHERREQGSRKRPGHEAILTGCRGRSRVFVALEGLSRGSRFAPI